MITAYMTVTRLVDDEEVDIEVDLTGQTECYGSADWRESGMQLSDWYVSYPKGLELTTAEEVRAEEALYRVL